MVVVVYGHFRSPDADGAKTDRLYLVLEVRDHACLVQGITSARHLHLGPLGCLHRYVPRQSLSSGLWGQAIDRRGAVPRWPWPLAHVEVVVWQGADAPTTQQPFTQVRSDWAGFFLLQPAPGTYTLRLNTNDGGYQAPTTVTLRRASWPLSASTSKCPDGASRSTALTGPRFIGPLTARLDSVDP